MVKYEVQAFEKGAWVVMVSFEKRPEAIKAWSLLLRDKASIDSDLISAVRLVMLTTTYIDETWRVKDVLGYYDCLLWCSS
jgi:hypothetical protein